jgi:hypothetical protein
MPGIVLLWLDYMFPRGGQVYASRRRIGSPIVQIMYSLGFYALIIFLAWNIYVHH